MLYYIVAALLLSHAMFWGLGLSWLVLPRVWRPVWWILAPGLGWALQSAVVWAGAHTRLAGTEAYAEWSELLPLTLLVAAVWKLGRTQVRARLAVLGRAWPVWVLLVAAGILLLWPMAQRGAWTLTSSSLGSCDHADYAAGARVFQEFSPDSDEGFLGLPEVTSVGSAESFFEFWLKLNHFTPSALIAHNATIFQLNAYQLVSVSGVVALLLTVPLVLLLTRATGLRGWERLVVAALYAFSPLGAYAVHQGALGQLYAAHGIAILTLAALGCATQARSRGQAWRYGVVVFAGIWLLAGSYNFILTVALTPAGAWLLLRAVRERSLREMMSVGAVFAVAFACTVALFWGRYAGVVERFRLFEQFNFGWPVPRLWPSSWVGLVADTSLRAIAQPWWWVASGLVVAAWLFGSVVVVRHRRSTAVAAVAFVAPVVLGWGILIWESRTRANASYDAFKIISVFLPGLLAGLCAWFAIVRRARWTVTLIALLAAANLHSGFAFARAMMRPPLRVERTLVELRRIESIPRFASLNMRIDDFWSRLWANYFLLRKPQYFATHTYEGRLNTALKGEWDLTDSLLHAVPRRAADYFRLNDHFHLERVGAPERVLLDWGSGWHSIEGAAGNRWRWSEAEARIHVTNPESRPLRVLLRLQARSTGENRVVLSVNGTEVGRSPVTASFRNIELKEVELPPGESELRLATEQPATTVTGDRRVLGIALAQLTVVATSSR